MGDRTGYTLQMALSDLTEKQVAKIVDRLFDGQPDEVDLDYGKIAVYEKSIGEVFDGDGAEWLAGWLKKKRIDREFRYWEDPKYEWLGTVAVHTPGLPLLKGDCDAEGQVLLGEDVVRQVLDETAEGQLVNKLRALIGDEVKE